MSPELVERLNQLQLSARSVVEGNTLGSNRSPVRGASIEFRQHRLYAPGDEPRRLDWRVLARTDRPYIKEYDEETNLRCVLLLDCSGSMGYGAAGGGGGAGGSGGGGRGGGSKFDYAGRLTAALAYLMLARTESVGLGLFDSGMRQWLAPRSGPGQLARVIDLLERAGAGGRGDPSRAMHETSERLDRRGLVIVVSDLLQPLTELRSGLAHLRHDRHEVIVMRMLHRDEIEFPFGSWMRFDGMEGERASLSEAGLVRRGYLARLGRHLSDVASVCGGLSIEHHRLITDEPLVDSMSQLLLRRAGSA